MSSKPYTTTIAAAAIAFACGLGLGIGGTTPGAAKPGAASSASGTSGSTAPPADDTVLALVNGAPITRADLQLKLDTGGHEAVASKEHEKNVLDALITREALAQKARSMGLEQDPAYLESAKKLGAQVRGFERQELSELLLRREGERRGAPSDESARAYFEANRPRIATELHVLQILRRSEAQAIEARNAIQNGKSFEEVAASLFPGLTEGRAPWDLGFLSFSKVPEPWREAVYALKPGETSGILRGPNERFWIIKLVEVRQNPDVTFESAKEAVIADMGRSGSQGAKSAIEAEVRASAKVEILTPLDP